jgi:large subunit ribosomal protein L5
MNPMEEVRLEKITLNIGAGEPGAKLDNAKKLLEKITTKKAMITRTHKRTTFGGPKKRPIGVKITLRGNDAKELLKMLLQGVENKITIPQFDSNGNFSFGIKEYIHIPGMKYDPDIGIIGMDVAVTLKRPGYRVKKRKLKRQKLGKKHILTKDDAMKWAKDNGIKVLEKREERYPGFI